jgi:tetratricopeptide (TPR) repeat protein
LGVILMKNSRSVLNAVLRLVTLSALLSGVSARTFAQDNFDYEAERKRAVQLIQAHKMPEAKPILEKLQEIKPDDTVVLEGLAYAVLAVATTEKDPEKRKKEFLRARSLAERAKQLGNNSDRIQLFLDQIPADGDMPTLTASAKRTPAEDALLEGESAFTKGEMERAIEAYERALKLEPKLYDAALFIGDAYHKMNKDDKAYEGYARAVAIDPDRDTAYRYWGDVLMRENKLKEAKEKLIEGVIAAPYTRLTWQFLINWAQRSQIQLTHPRIEPSGSMSVEKDQTNVTIDVNSIGKNDGSAMWMFYHTTRSQWIKGKFAKEFPDEKEYRHSLREEAEALGVVASVVSEAVKGGRMKEKDLDPSIANLLKIHNAGLLEAYVLLAKADAGIARDYAEYRKNNRDKLRQYLNEYVTAAK